MGAEVGRDEDTGRGNQVTTATPVMGLETTSSEVLLRTVGACGRITLNRPHAINALTAAMTAAIYHALKAWASDPAIHFVVLDGAGERGLCAGGDVRALHMEVKAGRVDVPESFFRQEYRLNYLIATYPKPYVALMEGIVMGGGIGVSAHGSHRVVTERSSLAMPETAIGFVPDVGGTHLLGTAPGEVGTFLGLTGARVGAADAIACGLADMLVASRDLPQLTSDLERCADTVAMEACLQGYSVQTLLEGTLLHQDWIGRCFAADTAEEIVAALSRETEPGAQAALAALQKVSPTSLKVTLKALRNARRRNDLASCLGQEYRIAQACLRRHDFAEGVRAALVDKDRQPRWQPATLEEVTPEDVGAHFAAGSAPVLLLQSL